MLPCRNISNHTSNEQETELEEEDTKKRKKKDGETGSDSSKSDDTVPKHALCVFVPILYIKVLF